MNATKTTILIAITAFAGFLCSLGCAQVPPADQSARTFSNPIARAANDPWVVKKDGLYYYCYASHGGIRVHRTDNLSRALEHEGELIWRPEPGKPWSRHIWAPELHWLGERWYVYFAADDGRNENHRMFVLESLTDNATGRYAFRGQLEIQPDRWAIDGTVMQHAGKLYFIWSGWEADRNDAQHLYIAQMASPTQFAGERVRISSPEHPWEMMQRPLVNEGPQVLQHDGRTFVIYSASGSWADHYCLGQLALVGDDPLDPAAWIKKDRPVFSGANGVISPGHASFTTSPDGAEHWIVYHAARRPGSGWDRVGCMQPFRWTAAGEPDFGDPVEWGKPLPLPSGE